MSCILYLLRIFHFSYSYFRAVAILKSLLHAACGVYARTLTTTYICYNISIYTTYYNHNRLHFPTKLFICTFLLLLFIFFLLFFFCYFNCTCCVLTIYIAYMYIYIIILFDFGFSFFVILNLLQHESFSETVCFSILLLIIIILLYFLLCYCIIVYIFCSKANRKKTQRTNERANGRTNR